VDGAPASPPGAECGANIPLSAAMTPQPVDESPRVRAPDFPARLDWVNTGGRALTLADLRGKVVLLDFWTYG